MIEVTTIFDSDREEYEYMQQKKEQPMKEQIEEITKITCPSYHRNKEKKCAGFQECDMKCLHYQRCEALYNAGYRKQKEGEWIYVHTYMRGRCSVCNNQMQYDNQPFCANCGAKMKRGE